LYADRPVFGPKSINLVPEPRFYTCDWALK